MTHLGGWKQPKGRVVSKWKPILVYSKGEWTNCRFPETQNLRRLGKAS